MTWSDVSALVSGTAPQARCSYGFASAGNRLYLHAGKLVWTEISQDLPIDFDQGTVCNTNGKQTRQCSYDLFN